ncbi:glycosyltransferase family 2 protein [Roseovarius sp. SYSU LYC5161]|uniref:glycosyltransferase family 2 protein n=1 Tax=Roseovarius halophilus (ex Wu et al. 2025) TaxID=3376060 RepID=UPI00399B6314
MPQTLAELRRFLDRPVTDDSGAPTLSLTHQLQAALAWCRGQDGPGYGPLAECLEHLLTRLAQDTLPTRIALQEARFELQVLRELHASPRENRLTGDAHAMGLLLARLLPDLPANLRKKAFSPADYRALNPDVANAGIDPLDHYLSGGAAEGRLPRALVREFPGSYPDSAFGTLAELAGTTAPPRFAADLPGALRDEALMLLGRERPGISVILPTWNRAHTVIPAVASALLQSFAPQEVIVVDDGSTDATADLLRTRFPEPLAEGRLVLIEQAQSGVSAARNAGLARAGGEIIAYLDSDNRWDPDHLLFGAAGLLAGRGAQSAYTALCRHNLSAGWSDILFRPHDPAALAEENYIDLNSFLHRRELHDRLGGFDSALTRFVDWDLILRYTHDSAPVALPVITGHHVIDETGLGNITMREQAEPNLARIRAKQHDAEETRG